MKAIERIMKVIADRSLKPYNVEQSLGLSNGYLSKMLKRNADLGETNLVKIANFLDIRLSELMGEDVNVYNSGHPESSGLPYYDIDVSASPIELFADKPEIPSHQLIVPGFEDCNIAINVWGDSMYPAYCSGDIIICKRIIDKAEVTYGEAYLVVTPERRLLKYIKKSKSRGRWLLVSENKFYDSFEVEIDKILHIFIVKGRVKRNTL